MKFSDDMGNAIVFELETTQSELTDGEQMLVKLGDGSFGCVFAVKGDNRLLALKVIYEYEAGINSNEQGSIDYKQMRVDAELRVRQTIFNKLAMSNDEDIRKLSNSYYDHLALPLAYSMGLDRDKEFQRYAKIYKKYDIVFSKYGYIMDRYDCSLKDLMEYGGHISSIEGAEKTSSRDEKKRPYGRLKLIPMLERERSALPIINQIGKGLHILHAAELRHQDIKPANIYYRNNMGSAKFTLGDLGFLNAQNPATAGSAIISADALAIGTKHYRSVEQIDHSDVSEVSIEPAEDKNEVILISRDPKFMHTNIGRGDLVMFPRSKLRTLFEIKDFNLVSDSSEARLTISSQETTEAHKDSSLFLRDGLTQAVFIKNATERTDLFGLGAILFDIVSAGESAERFYELLRKFDTRSTRIQSAILNYYPAWKTGQDVAPDISAIFQRVNGDKRLQVAPDALVSSSILAFLLNCLMSEPEDSYFMRFFARKSDEKRQGWLAVTDRISTLELELGAVDYLSVTKNALTSEKPPIDPPSRSPHAEIVSALLPEVQSYGHSPSRWTWVASFLRAMTRLGKVMGRSASPNSDVEFISMAPEHLIVDYNNNYIKYNDIIGTCKRSEYLDRLRVLDPLFSSVQSQPSSFLPIWWGARKSKVEIHLSPDDHHSALSTENASEEDDVIQVSVKYMSPAEPRRDTEAGDYLIVLNDDSLYSLYDITKIESGYLDIRKNKNVKEENNKDVEFHCDAYRIGYIVSAFNIYAYYGGMLSVYLFHSLLAGGDGGDVDNFGREVISKAVYFPLKDLPRPSSGFLADDESLWKKALKQKTEPPEGDLVAYTIRLYIWLMLGGFLKDAYSPESVIEEEIMKWSKSVGDRFGLKSNTLEDVFFKPFDNSNPSIDEKMRIRRDKFEEIARMYLQSS